MKVKLKKPTDTFNGEIHVYGLNDEEYVACVETISNLFHMLRRFNGKKERYGWLDKI